MMSFCVVLTLFGALGKTVAPEVAFPGYPHIGQYVLFTSNYQSIVSTVVSIVSECRLGKWT